MNVSYQWLHDYVDFDLPPDALAERLTLLGLEVEAVVPVGDDPCATVYCPTNDRIYVVNENSNTVTVVNAATGDVVKEIPVGSGPSGACYDESGGYILVPNAGDDTVSVIEYQPSAGDQPHAEGTPRNGPGSQTIAGHGAR